MMQQVLGETFQSLYHIGPKMNFVYADFTKEVKEIAQAIEEESAVSCRTFHGKMSDESKDLTLREFLDANIPILVATESFEVGVSNPLVDIVLRIGCMRNLNVLLQEFERCGGGRGSTSDMLVKRPNRKQEEANY